MSLAVLTSLIDALKIVLFRSTCNCKFFRPHNSFWGRNICIESDGFHFCISFKSAFSEMTRKHIFCAHFNDFVSRSTFERHELKRNRKNVTSIQKTGSFRNGQSMFQLSIKYSSGYDNEKTNKQTNYTATSNNKQISLVDNIAFAKVSCLLTTGLFFWHLCQFMPLGQYIPFYNLQDTSLCSDSAFFLSHLISVWLRIIYFCADFKTLFLNKICGSCRELV